MNDRVYADLLAKTYCHTVSAWRPLPDGGEESLCEAVPCALSRSAHTSAPATPDAARVLPEALYRLSLFTRPESWFALGDRVEVTDTAGRVFHGRTSDSVVYPSHCVTVVEVRETGLPAQTGGAFALGSGTDSEAVSPSAGNEGCGTCGNAVSCESCPKGEGL